jgi:hypothetical protein
VQLAEPRNPENGSALYASEIYYDGNVYVCVVLSTSASIGIQIGGIVCWHLVNVKPFRIWTSAVLAEHGFVIGYLVYTLLTSDFISKPPTSLF